MGTIQKMKESYVGIGKPGYLDKVSGKAVRNLLNSNKKQYINSSPPKQQSKGKSDQSH